MSMSNKKIRLVWNWTVRGWH